MENENKLQKLDSIWLSCGNGLYKTKEKEFRERAREAGFSRKEMDAYLAGEDLTC